ncbi:hypothetical protein AB0331_13430 [Dietzia maris]|uniref:hypothetical protein n=1 Tax=Dietzia maris TaxID=37915 RepID=UPI003450AE7E
MFSSLLTLVVMAVAGVITMGALALVGQKSTAVSLLGVAITAAVSYVLVLTNPAGAGELSTLWPLLAGLGVAVIANAAAASDLPKLPKPVDSRPGGRVINAATTSPQAVAAQPAPHWALG